MSKVNCRYFTLVELIVSMAIFLVIMLVLVTMLNDTIKLSRKRKQQADIYHQQQILGSIFSRDLENMIAKDEADEEIYLRLGNFVDSGSNLSAAFVTTSSLGVNSDNATECPLNGVIYLFDTSDSNLYRGIAPLSTPLPGTNSAWVADALSDSDVIAQNVESFSIVAHWPSGTSSDPNNTLPSLIEIEVKLLDENDTIRDGRNDIVKGAYRLFEKRIFLPGSN